MVNSFSISRTQTSPFFDGSISVLGGGPPSWLRFPLALSSKPSESMGIYKSINEVWVCSGEGEALRDS